MSRQKSVIAAETSLCSASVQLQDGATRAAYLDLPVTVARQLKVWAHRIGPSGDSEGLTARIEVSDGGESRLLAVKDATGQALVPLSGAAYQVGVTL